jgi:hypothetical protein
MATAIENNTLYRFRSMDKLLNGYKELESQSIFFAPPEILNDPVEGFRDIYFRGDKVMWERLLINYLLSLTVFTLDYLTFGEDKILDDNHRGLPSIDDVHDNLQVEFKIISKSFIQSPEIQGLINNIIKYREKVSQQELSYYLSIIHLFSLNIIYNHLHKINVIKENLFKQLDVDISNKLNAQYFEDTNRLIENYGENANEILIEQHNHFLIQMSLLLDLNDPTRKPNKKTLFHTFPQKFILKLEQVMYPNWFTACFMSRATNSSVWGNYGDNHKGACLVFETEIDDSTKPYIALNNAIVGADLKGKIFRTVRMHFEEMHYCHKQDGINFFDSIGQVPMGKLYSSWFVSDDGKLSSNTPKDDETWRDKYWGEFDKSITKKTKDWEYENEFRLIIRNMFGSYPNVGATLNYSFKSLKGIIFGIKTSEEDKHQVIKIVEKKVHESKHYDFKFYQAYYCRSSGIIKHTELSMLKFKSE